MLDSIGMRTLLGKPSAKSVMYLAAAMAVRTWWSRRSRSATSAPRTDATDERANAEQRLASGSRADASGEQTSDSDARVPADASSTEDAARARDDHAGAGITDLPPTAERDAQASLPPRGQRKPGPHA